jgi:hypothetical protein
VRLAIGAFLTAAIGLLSVQPALASYCGPASDTKAVEALTVARPPYSQSRIMYLAVVDSFAMAEIEWKGEFGAYFVKRNGRWIYSGASSPSNTPMSVKKRFDAIMDATPHSCANPHFVSHPSGP